MALVLRSTDSSAWLIQNRMNQSQRNDLMNMVFSPTTGIGVNYVRIAMGASDFTASGQYTYNDLPYGQTDVSQSNFSIAHDQQYIIPQLQQAQALNPNLQIMASPWSPPAWMKTNQSLIGGQLDPQYHASYASYFEKFIDAYAAEGLTIDSVSMQNEPHHLPSNYPGAYMSSAQQADLIKNHVGPRFAAEGIDTKIFLWDHNWDEPNYAIDALNDPGVKQYVAGTAFHGYAGDVSAQTTVRNAHPDREIHFTEMAGGDWAPNFSDNLVWGLQNIIIGNTRNWGQSAIYWNLALDENHGPRQGGCSNCRGVVTINSGTGNVTLNEEFYTIAHASKFVQPGAVRIDSRTINNAVETVAFKNPDGTTALIALNPGNSIQSFRIVDAGEHFSYSLPGKSVATFTWPFGGGEPIDPPTELLVNPGFENGGNGWSSSGAAGFHDFFGGNGHASLFTDNVDNSGSIFQTGIAAQEGQTFKFILGNTRIEGNADADVQYGLQFWGANEANKIGEELLTLELPGMEVNGGVFSMTGTAPSGTQFVRPIALFNNVAGTGSQRNIFFFDASLVLVPDETGGLPGDYNADGVVDAADYTVWRDNVGASDESALNFNGDGGAVGQSDYHVWRANFGMTSTPNAPQAASPVPEPRIIALLLVAFCVLITGRSFCKDR